VTSPPRVYEITFTVPAGTLPAAPFSQTWKTEDAVIADIELIVPSGHNGVTGFRVMKGDVQLLPFSRGTFLIANNYSRVFPIGTYIPTGDLKLQGYNQGVNPHSFYVRMTVTDYTPPVSSDIGNASQALPVGVTATPADPLSPDAILGPDTTSALASGTVTADDLTPSLATDVAVTP
jgi:hypothetical protein